MKRWQTIKTMAAQSFAVYEKKVRQNIKNDYEIPYNASLTDTAGVHRDNDIADHRLQRISWKVLLMAMCRFIKRPLL